VDTIDGDAPLHYSCNPRLMPYIGNGWVDPETGNPQTSIKASRIHRNSDMVLVMDGSQWQTDPTGQDNNWWGVQPVAWAIDNWRFGHWKSGTVASYSNATVDYLDFSNPSNDNGAAMEIGTNQDTGSSISYLWYGCTNGQVRFRHNNNTAANFLFVDGHVESHFVSKNLDALGNATCDLQGRNVNVSYY